MPKKLLLGAGAFIVTLGLMTSNAWAHQCTNASRSDQGDRAAAEHSQAWATFRVGAVDFLTSEFGLCEAGVNHVLNGLEAAGFDVDVVVNQRMTLAWGLAEHGAKGEQLLADGKGIDHIDFDWVEETATPLIFEAFEICTA